MKLEEITGVLKSKVVFQIVTMLCIFLFTSAVVFAAPADDFVITVKTDNTGASSDTQFEISTVPGLTYNYNVDCDNDGNDEAIAQHGDYTCDYGAGNAGTYTIRIKDNTGLGTGFPSIRWVTVTDNSSGVFISLDGDSSKLLSVNQWGTGHWTSMKASFCGCNNLNSAVAINNGGGAVPDWATDVPDLSGVTDMSIMFALAGTFNQDISGWNVSNVDNMSDMFALAGTFNQDMSSWNVSNVTSMLGMFLYAQSFNQDISGWNVANVDNMAGVFNNAVAFNQNLGNWNVSNVDNMTGMFSNSGMSTDNYDDTLIGWSARSLQHDVPLDSSAHYCRSENQRQHIIDVYNWTINDAGKSCNGQAISDDTTPVPTMSEWGMILTGLFILFASFVMIRRKRDN